MQSDRKLDAAVLASKSWTSDPVTGQDRAAVKRFELPSLERGKLSFSGNERNHLFLNQDGHEFTDISGISGLDSPQDGRSFAVWDYDRDGWQDIILLNTNTPIVSMFRNQLGSKEYGLAKAGKMVAVKFVGGNIDSQASQEYGNRDGFGARATVKLPNQTLIQEHRCGEGLAAQNTSYMLFGIGEHDMVDSISVQWPSGISQQIGDVRAGDLVKVYENAAESSDGSGFELSRYIVEGNPTNELLAVDGGGKRFELPAQSTAQLGMYTSIATWCPNCRKQIPQLSLLREEFSSEQLEMVGVPVDKNDSNEKLADYVAENQPPYELEGAWSQKQREEFNQLVNDQYGSDLLPVTILADRDGKVLTILRGVPTVSEITLWLRTLSSLEPNQSRE